MDNAFRGVMQRALLTKPEAAASLGIGLTKMKELIASGEIRVLKIGRVVRIEPEEIQRYISRLREEQAVPAGQR